MSPIVVNKWRATYNYRSIQLYIISGNLRGFLMSHTSTKLMFKLRAASEMIFTHSNWLVYIRRSFTMEANKGLELKARD